jgi:hypothetical protein
MFDWWIQEHLGFLHPIILEDDDSLGIKGWILGDDEEEEKEQCLHR